MMNAMCAKLKKSLEDALEVFADATGGYFRLEANHAGFRARILTFQEAKLQDADYLNVLTVLIDDERGMLSRGFLRNYLLSSVDQLLNYLPKWAKKGTKTNLGEHQQCRRLETPPTRGSGSFVPQLWSCCPFCTRRPCSGVDFGD